MSHDPAAQFDRVALAYATSAVHAQGRDLQWLLDALRPRPTWQVADFGAGAGHASLAVAPHVAHVHAIDLSQRMLDTAAAIAAQRGIANVSFLQAGVDEPPLERASMDAVISRFSAHHWTQPDAALDAAARIAKPGAPLVLIDTVSPPDLVLDSFLTAIELLRDASHARNGSIAEWTARLQRAGFELLEVREWPVELDIEEWMARAATEPWRADAIRNLLRAASSAARATFAIAADDSRFSIPGALLHARRPR